MFKMQGIYAPMACAFESDMGAVAIDKIAENVKKYNQTKLAGIVVMGSNGEFVYLTHEEKLAFVKAVCDNIAPDKHVIAGCGCESTLETIQMCKECAELGADAALVLTPNYYKGAMAKPAVIEQFFKDVADASPIPVILYNMPGNSGINIPSDVSARLAQYPNIIGEKDSGGNIVQISEVLRDADPDKFVMFAGSTSFLMATTLLGGQGGTLALADVLPNECATLFELSQAALRGEPGALEKAIKAQKILLQVNKAVTATYGIAGLKVALDHMGYYGGPVRKPLLPQTAENAAVIRSIVDAAIEGMKTL